jgi:hypothetical protein
MPDEKSIIRDLKDRVHNLEKGIKNLELEICTIDVLAGHVIQDVALKTEAGTAAAEELCRTILRITEKYR